MTEDDARERWCPFARVIAPITAPNLPATWTTGNRVSMPEHLGTVSSGDPLCPPAARCIGSACMAWRWKYLRTSGLTGSARNGGFCGLAGTPS